MEIALGGGLVSEVDDGDEVLVRGYRWYAVRVSGSKTLYAARRGDGGRGCVYMHRVIVGAKRGEVVRHRNGDGLDNRRSNLEKVERLVGRYGSSMYRGVYRLTRNRWRAMIRVGGVRYDLGLYGSEDAAAEAYSLACERFGVGASSGGLT